MLSEFELIRRFFPAATSADVIIGIGDDGCVLAVPADQRVVSAVSVISESTPSANTEKPRTVGHQALSLASNRLLARGVSCRWFTLALTLPESNEYWLEDFSQGLRGCAQHMGANLVGGDTTRGPLSIVVVAFGHALESDVLHLSGAQIGDGVFVTGPLGRQAAMTLCSAAPSQTDELTRRRILQNADTPTPRTALRDWLVTTAHTCVSLDQGLHTALSQLRDSNQLGVDIDVSAAPLEPLLRAHFELTQHWQPILTLSGDHDLLFSAPNDLPIPIELQSTVRCIGTLRRDPGIDYRWPAR